MENIERSETGMHVLKDNLTPEPMRAAGWTVKRKLFLSLAAVMLLFIAMAGIGFGATLAIQNHFDKVADDTLVELEALKEIQASALNLELETYSYVLFGQDRDLQELNEAVARLDEALESYAAARKEPGAGESEDGEYVLFSVMHDFVAKSEDVVALYEGRMENDEVVAAARKYARAENTLETVLEKAETQLDEELDTVILAMKTLVGQTRFLLIALPAVALLLTLGIGYLFNRFIVHPVENLTETALHITAGDLEQVATVTGQDELGVLARAFNSMTVNLREMLQGEREQHRLLKEATEHERLQQQTIEAQQQAILELSTPVIPIMDRILVMPMVGSIDSQRAQDIMRTLLAGIREHRARVVILDITGVPIVDSGVANHLNKTIQAAKLKGAHTIVTGMSDAVAEAIVDLGIDWSKLDTLSDLQTGLVVALKRLGFKLNRA